MPVGTERGRHNNHNLACPAEGADLEARLSTEAAQLGLGTTNNQLPTCAEAEGDRGWCHNGLEQGRCEAVVEVACNRKDRDGRLGCK
jgi:hypothetical protein